jgi:hypothetical protein
MPTLHANFWLSCLQLIHWAFLKPTTLRRYTAYLVSGLEEDSLLWEVGIRIFTEARLRKLIVTWLRRLL